MSQADEDTTTTTQYNVNGNQHNYNYYGQMRNTNINNQQVMPLYENCLVKTTNNNNIVKQKPDQILLERSPTKSETFNYEYRFVSNTTNDADLVNEHQTRDFQTVKTDYEYENINIGTKENLDKRILLQKYFRSALVGPRSNIYENLCRGCNYGVFNARGPLCTFCECIVNGVSALRSETPETSLTASNNIYENVCEYCGVIYSGSNCLECQCQRAGNSEKSDDYETVLKLGSEEFLLDKSVKEKKKVKINKSKSFSKTNKPKIFSNLWDTIRKPKSSGHNLVPKKPLEIIHHVEGYEQVFHTKDTFDLKKICELKRSVTSCSDQHIYGRLKLTEDLLMPQDEFNSTQSLTQSITTGKRPRVSKAKFLRTNQCEITNSKDFKADNGSDCTIYLNNSVCQWMTSLRREIHAYNTFDVDEQETLCYPKSIPSKNVLNSCKAPLNAVTNHMKNLQNLTNIPDNKRVALTEILTEFSDHNSTTSSYTGDIQEIENSEGVEDNKEFTCYQLMVEEFMANIINRQMLRTKSNTQQLQQSNVKATMAGVNNTDSFTNNCYHNNNSNDTAMDIPLRQPTLTAALAMTQDKQNMHNNKHKRQVMYLRLEEHLPNGVEQLQLLNNEHEINNKNNNSLNPTQHECIDNEREEAINLENNNGDEYIKSLRNPNTVKTPDTFMTHESEDNNSNIFPHASNTSQNNWLKLKTDKRRGIHERNVLEAFEALLAQETTKQLKASNKTLIKESQTNEFITPENTLQLIQQKETTSHLATPYKIKQLPDLITLIKQQHLSASLNTLIICYDKYLKIFLYRIQQKNTSISTRAIVFSLPNKQLVRKFKRFYNYCEQNGEHKTEPKTLKRVLTCVSSKLKLDLNVTKDLKYARIRVKNTDTSDSLDTLNDFAADKNNCASVLNLQKNPKIKTPPQVPKRDPKTKLSPTLEIKTFVNDQPTKMTKPPGVNIKTEIINEKPKEEESIYQPIWKFETKGQVTERYRTDDDYYDFKALRQKFQQDSPHSEIPKILISSDLLQTEEEDHNNWETDEEFVFSKQQKKQRSSSLTSDRMSTIRSNHSSNSSIGTSSSLSGSTITEFASSTATLASTLSCSLRHYLFRNVGIFYSLSEPKLRAIIYDYDRIHSTRYFAKTKPLNILNNDSGLDNSLSPPLYSKLKHSKKSLNSNSSTPSTSAKSSPISLNKRNKSIYTTTASDKCNGAKAKVLININTISSTPQTIPASVQAWKLQLMDVNYMEDEEDLIVSECEILRAQQIKEDINQTPPTQPQQFMQRFKSRSTENFLDLPTEDDKKTIAERLANMYTRFSPIQRGILNINGRNSPKSEKKSYKLNRATQSTSLYLEDGLKPKYPIFGAPLDQLELQQNVPRFVVDAVEYIERKDRIIQDGIYRACGNKFSIDELKHKLTNNYIYDSKIIVADDIHTVTSLLKQFFRDLPEPLIPEQIYSRVTANLNDKECIDMIRIALEEMKEPNKSTLRFLIKHLTNVAAFSSSNRMNASNVAIVWGPSLFVHNDTYDMIGRMNTLTKVLIENYDRIFATNERLL